MLKLKKKKLDLSTERVRELTHTDLREINGGAGALPADTLCPHSQRTCNDPD